MMKHNGRTRGAYGPDPFAVKAAAVAARMMDEARDENRARLLDRATPEQQAEMREADSGPGPGAALVALLAVTLAVVGYIFANL